jgi:hypothetical protein
MPLNEALHRRLVDQFGSVTIAKQGESLVGYRTGRGSDTKFEIVSSGEYYRTNCPYCLDTRKRLWINHRWGVGPDGDPDQMWWAAICYNDECLSKPGNLKSLRQTVYGGVGRERFGQYTNIQPGIVADDVDFSEVPDPGKLIPLAELGLMHPANAYLVSRGFDPYKIGPAYGLTVCEQADPRFRVMQGRIVVPVYMDGLRVTWQGRAVGEQDWRRVPKYYNMPGPPKRKMLYGFDAAKLLPYVILVEGVTDMWAVGPPAVALLGKTMSNQQFELITKHWKYVIVMLDEEAQDNAADLYALLEQHVKVIRMKLPTGADPATTDHDYLFELLDGTCLQQGIDLLQLGQTLQAV